MNKSYVIISITVALVLSGGLLIPLDSYTTTKGCPSEPTPTQRLHLIMGDSIEKIKRSDTEPPPNVGCAANTKFILYTL